MLIKMSEDFLIYNDQVLSFNKFEFINLFLLHLKLQMQLQTEQIKFSEIF